MASLEINPSPDTPGMTDTLQKMMDMIMIPALYPHLVNHLHLDCPRGMLLHGPPGVGKTRLVKQVAAATGAHLIVIQGPQIYSPFLGESEGRLRGYFDQANEKARSGFPCLLFIDEIVGFCCKDHLTFAGCTHAASE